MAAASFPDTASVSASLCKLGIILRPQGPTYFYPFLVFLIAASNTCHWSPLRDCCGTMRHSGGGPGSDGNGRVNSLCRDIISGAWETPPAPNHRSFSPPFCPPRFRSFLLIGVRATRVAQEGIGQAWREKQPSAVYFYFFLSAITMATATAKMATAAAPP